MNSKSLLSKNMYSGIESIAGIIRMEGIVISRSYNYFPGRNRKVLVLSFQLFAYLAFVVSVIWIYTTANEIVNLLQVKLHN